MSAPVTLPEAVPIAIVIPAFNAARTIGRAVRSALQQPHVSRVLVVDDGSTDETVGHAQTAGATVRRQVNAGPAAARNAGIDHAGELPSHVLFLDADDELAPGAADAVAQTLARWPQAAAVVGGHIQTGPGTPGRVRRPDPAWIQRGVLPDRAMVLGANHLFCATGLTLTRRAIQAGLRFDPALRFAEDRDILYRAGEVGPIAIVDALVVRKHDSPGQMTASPAQVRRWLADQLVMARKHGGADASDAAREQLRHACSWVFKNTCRVLARAGQRLTRDEWAAAAAAFRELGWPVPLGARKWHCIGWVRGSLRP